jgi:lipoate-protein ligase A
VRIGPARAPGGSPPPADPTAHPTAHPTAWPVRRVAGGASVFGLEPVFPSISFVTVDEPLLVLGSTQSPSVVVSGAPGVAVTRRTSGGGAVLLEPGRVVWVDVAVPAGHPLWDRDVGRAFHWLGAVWSRAIGARAQWHEGPSVRSAFSDLVCFAGLGSGEVAIDGRKVVGISQRRTRAGALFQCAALIEWSPALLATMLGIDASAIADVAVGLAPRTGPEVESAFLAALTSAGE